jgi:nicastrin
LEGFSHKLSGRATGILYGLATLDELENFLMRKPSFSVIVVLEPMLFTRKNLEKLHQTKLVAGILVMPSDDRSIVADSPEVVYPNRAYGLYPFSSYEWNPRGNGFSYDSFDYPIFRLSRNYTDLIKNATFANKHSGYVYPLKGMELSAFMWAAHDSQTCLRRKFCLPLGGKSVYSSLRSIIPGQRRKTILVTSTLDSSAFFHDSALGGDAFTASIVAALAITECLNRLDVSSFNKNVVFAFFDAEAWGFSGSRKFVYDLNQPDCLEIDLNDPSKCLNPRGPVPMLNNFTWISLDYIIDLNQVAGINYGSPNGTLFLHMDNQPNPQSSWLADLFVQIAMALFGPGFMKRAFPDPAKGPGLPPGSLMSFLQMNRSIPSVMVSDFNDSFANSHFFSAYDDALNINLTRTATVLCQLSTIVANVVYALATDTALDLLPPEGINSNCTLVSGS